MEEEAGRRRRAGTRAGGRAPAVPRQGSGLPTRPRTRCLTPAMEQPRHRGTGGYNQRTQGEQSKPPHTLAPVPERASLLLAF